MLEYKICGPIFDEGVPLHIAINDVNYIYSMLKREVDLYCLVEMESNPFGDDRVSKLHVTGVR